jgi:GDPmannose 4,6-dehydratase
MWLMVNQDTADDYVVATGSTHSVRELCELAFSHAGLDWQDHVVVDARYLRPAEVDLLVGDPAKAKAVLGWEPEVDFSGLVEMMVDADLALVRDGIR